VSAGSTGECWFNWWSAGSTGAVPYMEGKVQSDFHFSMRTWGTLLVPQVLMPFKQWN